MEPDQQIVGWGADRRKEDRPGVPQEVSPPHPFGNPHWLKPELQLSEKEPLVGSDKKLTPVYSTANPPRGLSGIIRRAAYRIPDYRARRWMMLMLADRIDVIEHNLGPITKLLAGAGAFALVLASFRALRDS